MTEVHQRECDTLQRFIFEKHSVRGAIIHLNATYAKARANKEYTFATQRFLGEALAGAGLLASTIKQETKLTLQIESQGPLKLLLAQANESLHLRGMAMEESEVPNDFHQACMQGQLLINIDPASGRNRYQAVTELKGQSIAETINMYFNQSEQLPTRVWLFADEQTAGGLLIQAMPSQGDEEKAFWEHIQILSETVKPEEILKLDNLSLLQRLYHEEDIRLFDADPVCFRCTCTLEKMKTAIKQLGEEEAKDILKTHRSVEVTCEFCNRSYEFDKVDIAEIFSEGNKLPPSSTQH